MRLGSGREEMPVRCSMRPLFFGLDVFAFSDKDRLVLVLNTLGGGPSSRLSVRGQLCVGSVRSRKAQAAGCEAQSPARRGLDGGGPTVGEKAALVILVADVAVVAGWLFGLVPGRVSLVSRRISGRFGASDLRCLNPCRRLDGSRR